MRKNGGNKKRVVYVRGMFMYSCVLPKVWEHPWAHALECPSLRRHGLVTKRSKSVHLLQKSVIDMI